KLGYQTRSFAEAARALGVEVVFASDRCQQLEDPWSDGAIALHFDQPEEAARRIVRQSLARHVDGLIALGDRPTTAARSPARSRSSRTWIFLFSSRQAVGAHSSARPVPMRHQTDAPGSKSGR